MGSDPDLLYYLLILERLSGDLEAFMPKRTVIAPIVTVSVQHQLLAVANECYINWKTEFLNPLTHFFRFYGAVSLLGHRAVANRAISVESNSGGRLRRKEQLWHNCRLKVCNV